MLHRCAGLPKRTRNMGAPQSSLASQITFTEEHEPIQCAGSQVEAMRRLAVQRARKSLNLNAQHRTNEAVMKLLSLVLLELSTWITRPRKIYTPRVHYNGSSRRNNFFLHARWWNNSTGGPLPAACPHGAGAGQPSRIVRATRPLHGNLARLGNVLDIRRRIVQHFSRGEGTP